MIVIIITWNSQSQQVIIETELMFFLKQRVDNLRDHYDVRF